MNRSLAMQTLQPALIETASKGQGCISAREILILLSLIEPNKKQEREHATAAELVAPSSLCGCGKRASESGSNSTCLRLWMGQCQIWQAEV